MDIATVGDKNVITIRNAYKTYDRQRYIIRDLNMTVQQGTIYSLLGPSGCGKSTILNAIIGLLGLNSGTIELSIRNKCDVGYMPQSVSLYAQLTIEESLSYYGTMYGMDLDVKRSRIDLMFRVLDLPNRNLCPNELSGGQKRRVSLAIALLHDPKLLILDEPTVGVDPVLRHRIWEFLFDWIRTGGKTVIMTTHYIDEAKQTNIVGLMREGEMICEKSPQLIMSETETDNLEDAFLKLSQRQQHHLHNRLTDTGYNAAASSKKLIFSSLSVTRHTLTKSRFKEELKKNMMFIVRNLMISFIVITMPVTCITIFYFSWGKFPENLSLAVVNDEVPANSKFCDNYVFPTNCSTEYLSCRYLKKLQEKTIILVEYNSVDEAKERIKDTNIWGVIHFRADFTNALSIRIEQPSVNDDLVIDNSTIAAYMDYSNKIIQHTLSYNFARSYLEMIKDVFANCNLPVKAADLPIKFEKPIYGKLDGDYREYLGCSLLVALIFSLPLVFGGIILIEEKSCGALSRSLVAGISFFEILAAHVFTQISVHLCSTFSSVIMAFYILKFDFNQPFYNVSFLLLQGCVGTAFTLTLSTFLDSLVALSSVAIGLLSLTIIVSGIVWPLEGMHWLLKPLSWLTPFTFSSQAYRSIAIRGWDITHMDVLLGYGFSVLWMLCFILFTTIYIKRNRANLFVSKYVQ